MIKHKLFFLLLFIFLVASANSPQVVADPSDTVADATIVQLNSIYNETIDAYNDRYYYNFTGSPFQIYNFTMVQEGNNLITISLYDDQGNFLDSNSTNLPSKRTILYQGKGNYTLGVFGSEFIEGFPVPISISVTIATGEPGISPASSKTASLGSQSDTFTEGSQSIWYKFMGSSDKSYNITMTHSEGNYSKFEIYNSTLNQLRSKYDSTGYHSFEVTGYDEYLLRPVSDFEFMELPHDFIITINEIAADTDDLDTTGPTDNNLSSTDRVQVITDSGENENILANLPVDNSFIFFGLTVISLIYYRKQVNSQ